MRHKFTCMVVALAMALVVGFNVAESSCDAYPNPCLVTTNTLANDVSPPQTSMALVCDASGINLVMTLQNPSPATFESPPAVCANGNTYDNYATNDAKMTVTGNAANAMTPATVTLVNSAIPNYATWVTEFPNPFNDDAEINCTYVNTGPQGAPRKCVSGYCVNVEAGSAWSVAQNATKMEDGRCARDHVQVAVASGMYFGRCSPQVAMVLIKKMADVRGAPAMVNVNHDSNVAGSKSHMNC